MTDMDKEEKTIEYKGFKMRVFYNTLKPKEYNLLPLNCWYGYSEFKYNGKSGYAYSPLNDTIESLEEAVKAMKPEFIKYIDSLMTKSDYIKIEEDWYYKQGESKSKIPNNTLLYQQLELKNSLSELKKAIVSAARKDWNRIKKFILGTND